MHHPVQKVVQNVLEKSSIIDMPTKTAVWIGMFAGSSIGGAIPLLWGGSMFSFSSVLLTAVGGMVGIYLGFKISNW